MKSRFKLKLLGVFKEEDLPLILQQEVAPFQAGNDGRTDQGCFLNTVLLQSRKKQKSRYCKGKCFVVKKYEKKENSACWVKSTLCSGRCSCSQKEGNNLYLAGGRCRYPSLMEITELLHQALYFLGAWCLPSKFFNTCVQDLPSKACLVKSQNPKMI